MTQRTVGVLGGMGPESTAALFLKIIRLTPVTREQDHLRVLIDSNPKVPDRTEALLSANTAPAVAALIETARNLERSGASVIGMPCNTAHAFLGEIRASVTVPVLDMIDLAARQAHRAFGPRTAVGVLATDGTVHARLYHDALARHGVAPLVPHADGQRAVMRVIAEVKSDGVSPGSLQRLLPAIEELFARGAAGLIAACTEISLVLAEQPPDAPWLDPLDALAEGLVRAATE